MERTPRKYLEDTSHTVRHLYLGLESIELLWQDIEPMLLDDGRPKPGLDKEDFDVLFDASRECPQWAFSEAVLCGAILEVAFMGIQCFSKVVPKTPPESCRPLFDDVSENPRFLKFCVGEERYGVPEGLLIYAGRNQYAHWDEKVLKDPLNKNVFRRLHAEFPKYPTFERAFDLSNPQIDIYARFILRAALGWAFYKDYVVGMRRVLGIT